MTHSPHTARIALLAIALSIAGCVSNGGSTSTPSTPYKGDARWNISMQEARAIS